MRVHATMLEIEFEDFYAPTAGFGQPLALVDACHERVRRMAELLIRLLEHLREHGADKRAAISARAICDYFSSSWARHFQDEELDLFPRVRARLRERQGPQAQRILEAIMTLTEQHRDFLPLWKQIEPTLRAVQERTAHQLSETTVRAFVEAYRSHLQIEEDVLAPAYVKLLTPEDLRQIGAAMAARRGVTWPPPGR